MLKFTTASACTVALSHTSRAGRNVTFAKAAVLLKRASPTSKRYIIAARSMNMTCSHLHSLSSHHRCVRTQPHTGPRGESHGLVNHAQLTVRRITGRTIPQVTRTVVHALARIRGTANELCGALFQSAQTPIPVNTTRNKHRTPAPPSDITYAGWGVADLQSCSTEPIDCASIALDAWSQVLHDRDDAVRRQVPSALQLPGRCCLTLLYSCCMCSEYLCILQSLP